MFIYIHKCVVVCGRNRRCFVQTEKKINKKS